MSHHVHSIHTSLGDGRAFGLPVEPLRWREEELLAYRDFIAGRLEAQVADSIMGAKGWPRFHDPSQVLQRWRDDFARLMEERAESLRDYWVVRRRIPYCARTLHETPRVRALDECFHNPSLPWLRFRLAGLFDRLEEETGRAELHRPDGPWWGSGCWIRDLGIDKRPGAGHDPLRVPFLNGLPDGPSRPSDARDCLGVADEWLRVERVNKTSFARLRLVTPTRVIEFSNTRRARVILAGIRRCWWRFVHFAVADRLRVYFVRSVQGDSYDQLHGVPSSDPGKAWCAGRGAVKVTHYSASAPALGCIGLMQWGHPRLVAARALWQVRAQWLRSVLCSVLSDGLVERRLDEALPDGDEEPLDEDEAHMLEEFERDGRQWWRVWTFDTFRDFPVAEFSSRTAAVRFLRANSTLTGIRIGMGFRRRAEVAPQPG